jgi:hypothetical protein
MKKVLLFALVLMVSLAFVSTGFAQEKPKAPAAEKPAAKPAEKPAAAPEKPAAAAPDKPAAAPEKPAEPAKPKPKPIPGFVGTVEKVDAGLKLLTVKGAKATVTFDVSKAMLKGYKAPADVKVGDKVAVQYKKDGTMVTKIAGAKVKKEKAKEEKPKADKPKKEKKADKPKEEKPKAAPAEKPAAKPAEKPAAK